MNNNDKTIFEQNIVEILSELNKILFRYLKDRGLYDEFRILTLNKYQILGKIIKYLDDYPPIIILNNIILLSLKSNFHQMTKVSWMTINNRFANDRNIKKKINNILIKYGISKK